MCEFIKSIIGLSITILLFISIFHILSYTKADLSQERFSKGEKDNFFYTKDSNPLINFYDIGFKCEMYQNAIMNPKTEKLGDIFKLNIKLINEKINSLLIVVILSFVFLVFYLVCLAISISKKSLSFVCLSCIMIIVSVGFSVANFILLYKVIMDFYNSDMNQFMEFLKCKNVNREGFIKYLYVEDLYYHFKRFVFLSVIHILWNLSSNKIEKKEEQSQTNTNTQAIELVEN